MAQEKTPDVALPSVPAGWRPARRARPVPQHDWQVEPASEHVPTVRWRRLRLVGWCVLLTGLLGCFLLVALDVPERTPLLIVTDVRAGAIPQSPWLAEEVDRLKLLNCTTLTVREYAPAASAGTTATEFRQALQQLAPAASRTGAVIVYLRLPGLVDDAGRPCMIPSQTSLVRSEEWLPIEMLLDQVAGDVFPERVQRLVVLDRCQSSSAWNAGVLQNTFGDQLAALVKRRHHAGQWATLHLLSDTTGPQQGWDSPALGGSIFGEAVWSALTGRADASDAGGKCDRHVSLREMAEYVTRRTSTSVWENRRRVQTPCLLSPTDGDFRLFFAAPESTRQTWQAAADTLRTPVARESSLHRMKQFWTARRTLDERGPWHCDPVAWQQLNRRLVEYERLLSGGASAARQRDDVERAIQSLLATLENTVRSRPPLSDGQARLPHRHLARRLNSARPGDCERVADVFDQIKRRPSRAVAAELLRDLRQDGALAPSWDLVVLRHLVADAPDSSWSRPDLMTRTLGLIESLGEAQALSNAGVGLMLEPQCRPLEAALRTILDCLFVGTDERLATATSALTDAEQGLADCHWSARDLLKAVEWRNRAAADLPRLAEWIYATASGDASPEAKRGVDDWMASASSWKRLEAALFECGERGATVESAAMAASLATQLDRELSGLWSRVEQMYDRLLTDTPDAAAVAEMERLLTTSLLPRQPDSRSRGPVEQRMTLHETWLQASSQLAIQFASARSPGPRPKASGSDSPDGWMIQIAQGAAPHPMVAMLSTGDEHDHPAEPVSGAVAGRTSPQLWERSARVRSELAEIRRDFQHGRHASFDSMAARDRAWRIEAQRARAAASWIPNDLPYNPCQRVELAAISSLLRNRAASTVDDFWAGQSDSGPAFFVHAAQDLLDAADLCEADWRGSLTEAGKSDANRTRRKLAAAQNRTGSPLAVTAITVPQVLATDELRTEVDVRRSAGGLLPSGSAAVFLSAGSDADETAAVREAALISPPSAATESSATTRVALRSPPPNDRSDGRQPTRACVYFRGHRFTDDFQLAPTAGLTVRSNGNTESPTTVTVQSSRRRPTAILFILDASASMTDDVAREGTRGTIRKIDAAVEALTSLLGDFADENNVRIGVLFYGHRVASGETAGAGVLRQPLYQRRFPFAPTLQPFEDVETVLPVGRFGPAELGRLEDRLTALRPWGETPLYLSLIAGLEQFEAVPADATKAIVVITDGLNYQFNPTPEKRTEVDDVLRAARGRDVAVHLLGFGVPEAEVEQARDEFTRISAATGGSADVEVRDAARLQSRLRALYQPGRFTIANEGDFRQSAQAGEAILLPRDGQRDEPFEIRYEVAASRVSVEGGERLVFRPADDGTLRVVSDLPYLRTSLRERDSGLNAPCELVASRPMRDGNDLVVRWSLRRQDGQFTPRPAVGCFRVQPLDARGKELGPAAVCLGPASVPGQPLPTWEFRIASWPREASTARLEGSIRPSTFSAARAESCADLLKRQRKSETWQALPVPAVRWQVRHDGRSVTLVERYDGAADEPRVWTELTRTRGTPGLDEVSGGPTLVHIERRHDAAHRLFVQTWNFDRDLAPNDLGELQFQFIALEPTQTNDWAMSEPLPLSTVPQAVVIQPAPTRLR